MPPEWVEIGRTGRTRGLRGELYAQAWGGPDRLLEYGEAAFRRADGSFALEGRTVRILEAKPYKDGLILLLEGIGTIEQAEALEHCALVVPPAKRPVLAEGEYYLADLVGCEVIERQTGRQIGKVLSWQEFGGPDLLEVAPAGAPAGEVIWIPLVRTICVEVDPANRRIVVDPPEGLLDLNR